MASHRRHGKEREIDRSSPWSEQVWDTRGFWVSSRYGPDGAIEYDYQYPDNNQEPQTGTVVQSFGDPRTPRNASGSVAYSSFNSEATASIDSSSTWGAAPGGNAGYDRGSSQRSVSPNYTTQAAYAANTETPQAGDSYPAQSVDSSNPNSVVGSSSGPGGFTSYSSYGDPSPGPSYTAPLVGGMSSQAASSSYSAPYVASDMSSSGSYNPHSTDLAQSFGGLSLAPLPKIDEHNVQGTHQVVKNIRRVPDSENFEELDHRYQEVPEKNQRRFWIVGRVFMMLWTEPARTPIVPRGGGTRNGSHFSTTYLGETAYSEIRRFVVVKEGHGNNICSPIHTYSGQATLKWNLPEPQEHAIIYTSKKPPQEHSYKAEDGTVVWENLNKDPIRVISEQHDKEGDLGNLSRINYSKIYTVENYVRVLNIGRVHQDSMESLIKNASVKPRTEPPQKPRNHPSSNSNSKGNKHRQHNRFKDEDRGRDRGSRSSGRDRK
jgi:hypothetical protein